MSRLKDEHEGHNHILEGLSPEMQAFNKELAQRFPKIKYTSGKRNPSQKVGKAFATSHHNTGNAVDISAEHKDVFEWLNNDPEGLTLLTKYGLGIIDETDPEMMKKTGATGKHYHIGKDSKFAKLAQDKLKTVQTQAKPETPQQVVQLNMGQNTDFVTAEQFKKELDKISQKEKDLEEKTKLSAEMQEIEDMKNEKMTFLSEALKTNVAPSMKSASEEYQQQQSLRFDPEALAQNTNQPLFSTGQNIE